MSPAGSLFRKLAAALACALMCSVPALASGSTHLTYHTAKQYQYAEYPWHQSIALLWKIRWKPVATAGVYPFDQWSNVSDFESIFTALTDRYPDQTANDFDDDRWAQPFLGPAQQLLKRAREYEVQGQEELAKNTYLRSAAIFRIGYFPWYGPNSKSRLKAKAWDLEKHAYEAGMRLSEFDFQSVAIPFEDAPAGSFSKTIPIYVVGLPKSSDTPSKVVLMIGGLDHYRTGQQADVELLCKLGYAVVVVDMPGTGDSPISAKNPDQDAAIWKRILDWIEVESDQRGWAKDSIYGWGLSTGSYWSIKLSRSEKDRLQGVLVQGAASHFTFEQDWLESADHLAYPVALWGPLAKVFGYTDKSKFAQIATKYSLLRQGVLDAPAAPVTVVNGVEDTVFPIDDALLLAMHGDGANLRLFKRQGHMGQPASGSFVQQFWKALSS